MKRFSYRGSLGLVEDENGTWVRFADAETAIADAGVPNLDTLDETDLLEVAEDFALLSRYAQIKRKAMIHRKVGDVKAALDAEAQCDALYKLIPEKYRW